MLVCKFLSAVCVGSRVKQGWSHGACFFPESSLLLHSKDFGEVPLGSTDCEAARRHGLPRQPGVYLYEHAVRTQLE